MCAGSFRECMHFCVSSCVCVCVCAGLCVYGRDVGLRMQVGVFVCT